MIYALGSPHNASLPIPLYERQMFCAPSIAVYHYYNDLDFLILAMLKEEGTRLRDIQFVDMRIM